MDMGGKCGDNIIRAFTYYFSQCQNLLSFKVTVLWTNICMHTATSSHIWFTSTHTKPSNVDKNIVIHI